MRLQQFLTEGIKKYNNIKTPELISMVYDKCMPFIKELTTPKFSPADDFLYSGRHHSTRVFVTDIRSNRTPVDTTMDTHKEVDDLFKKKFGWKARSNAIFCTGDYNFAGSYGENVYMIFPIGKYKYLWSPEIGDLYIVVDLDSVRTAPNKLELFTNYINTYKNTDLKDAIKSGNEIMVNCKEYIAVHGTFSLALSNYFKKYGTMKPTEEALKDFTY